MNRRLIEYDEIGMDILKRRERELNLACLKLKYLMEVGKCLRSQ